MNAQAAHAAAAALAHPSSVWDTLVAARAAKRPAVAVLWPFVAGGTCVLPVFMARGHGELRERLHKGPWALSQPARLVVCEGLVQSKG